MLPKHVRGCSVSIIKRKFKHPLLHAALWINLSLRAHYSVLDRLLNGLRRYGSSSLKETKIVCLLTIKMLPKPLVHAIPLGISRADKRWTLHTRIFNIATMGESQDNLFNVWTYDKAEKTKITDRIVIGSIKKDATLADIRASLIKSKLDSKKWVIDPSPVRSSGSHIRNPTGPGFLSAPRMAPA